MVSVESLCKRRTVRKLDLLTPILIPSFSSKGFPEVKWLWEESKAYLTDVALISSYDLHHNFLDVHIDGPTVLFVDSGCYEARPEYDLSEIYVRLYESRDWSMKLHVATVAQIQALAPMVLVSYDDWRENADIVTQVDRALKLFEKYPEAATDFLIKPSKSGYLNIEEIEKHISAFDGFDILGVTEKELGASLVERLKSIVRLRSTLAKANLDIPIHVFGCLDPLSIWLFYLCGADVFDGLSWLRFAFYQDIPIYRNTWAAIEGQGHLSEPELMIVSIIHNIGVLRDQRTSMSAFCSDIDMTRIPINADRLIELMAQVGVHLPKGGDVS